MMKKSCWDIPLVFVFCSTAVFIFRTLLVDHFHKKRTTTPKDPNKTCDYEVTHNTNIIEETAHLLNIFPEVVWYQIADNLWDQNDIQNFINSSQFFRNLLLHKRNLLLFQPVFKILTTYLIGDDPTNTHTWSNASEVKSLVLNCRLVCRPWNKSIQLLSQQIWNPDWNIGTSSSTKPIKKYVVGQIIKKCYYFSSIPQITKFIDKFGSSYYSNGNNNPFPGRGISIALTSNELTNWLSPEFYQKITQFLEIFGQHVLHCGFFLNFSPATTNEAYYKLVELLGALPNLQNLLIADLAHYQPSPTLRRLPPIWKNLHSLKFVSVGSTLCNAILCDNWPIKKILIEKSPFVINTESKIHFNCRFENLEQLELRGCTWKEIKTMSLSNLSKYWPLKRLHLQFYPGTLSSSIHWTELFDVVSKTFNETLEELVLVLPEETEEEGIKRILKDSRKSRLNLPKLKKLNLTVKNDCSFDFLLGMNESLEWLRICVDKWKWTNASKEMLKVKRRQTLKIIGYHNKLYKSNIWKLFPKLKTVILSGWGWNNNGYAYNRWEWRKTKSHSSLFKRKRRVS